MKSDLYTKIVLTIIAVCLVYIAIMGCPPSYRLKNGKRALAVIVSNTELDVNVTNPDLDVKVTNPTLDVSFENRALDVNVLSGTVSVNNTVKVRGNFTEASIVSCPTCRGSGEALLGQCPRCRGTGRVTVD